MNKKSELEMLLEEIGASNLFKSLKLDGDGEKRLIDSIKSAIKEDKQQ